MKTRDQSWDIGRSTCGVETLDMESEGAEPRDSAMDLKETAACKGRCL